MSFSLSTISQAQAHIDAEWRRLSRYVPHDDGSLIGVPKPYVVPSRKGREDFEFNELYYWDSFFIAQGLFDTRHEAMARHLFDNLSSLFDRFGMIPNGNRYYHVGHSQPPLLTQFAFQLYERNQDLDFLAHAIRRAEQEYHRVWLGRAHPNWRLVYEGLSRYYDPNMLHTLAELESGWDMTSRFDRRALDFIPIDLNTFLYVYEQDFARAAELLGDPQEAERWRAVAGRRREQIDRYLWDEELGCYFDYDFRLRVPGSVFSLAAYVPLWAGLASQEQAAALVAQLPRFEKIGGLSTTEQDPGLTQLIPEQWTHPNGWAPLHWLVTRGLERYGYLEESERIKRRWLHTNLSWFCKTGDFIEKYNVVAPHLPPKEGLYPLQVGFGWTNAVFSVFARELFGEQLASPAGRLDRHEILELSGAHHR